MISFSSPLYASDSEHRADSDSSLSPIRARSSAQRTNNNFNDNLMLDFVARCPTDRTLSIGGDSRVVAPMALRLSSMVGESRSQPPGVPNAHGRPDPHHANKLVEADKHAKYDQL